MWIFNKDGFFSAVEHVEIPEAILVRARIEGDLENMLTHVEFQKPLATLTEVQHTPDHDYPYRVVVMRWAFAKYMFSAAKDIDYINFKDAVVPYGTEDRERSEKYHEVWYVMQRPLFGGDFYEPSEPFFIMDEEELIELEDGE